MYREPSRRHHAPCIVHRMRLREHCRIAIGRQRRPDDPQLRTVLGSSRSLDVHRAINHALAQSTARMRSRPRWWDQHAPRGAKATQHASRCRRPPCASGLELSQLEGSLIRTRMRSSISDLHACTLRAVRAKAMDFNGHGSQPLPSVGARGFTGVRMRHVQSSRTWGQRGMAQKRRTLTVEPKSNHCARRSPRRPR